MEYKFTVTRIIKKYCNLGEHYDYVDFDDEYECKNWDDLQNLLLTFIDFGKKDVTFKVHKEESEEVSE